MKHDTRLNHRFLHDATYAAESLIIPQHFHLVDTVYDLRWLLHLLVDYFDRSVIRSIRVLFELDTVVNQKVHEPLFLLWW